MVRRFRNADVNTRVFIDLQVDGHTLELEPGQEVELDLPEDFEDVNLVPIETTGYRGRRSRREPDSVVEQESASA